MPSNPTITINIDAGHPRLAEVLAILGGVPAQPASQPPALDLEAATDFAEESLVLFDDATPTAGGRRYNGRQHDQYPRPYTPKELRVVGWAMMRAEQLENLCREKRTTADLVLFVLDSLARLTGPSGRFVWSNEQLAEVLGIKSSHITSATAVLINMGALERTAGRRGGRLNIEVAK